MVDPNVVRRVLFNLDSGAEVGDNFHFVPRMRAQVGPFQSSTIKCGATSSAIVSVWDRNSIVGFARGIGDEVRYAQVLDVLVHPDYRRMGIGQELIRRLVSAPSMRVRAVILGTPTMREFYEATGFQCVNDKAFLMVMVRDEYGEDLIQPKDE